MLRKGMLLAGRYEIIEQIGTGGMSDVYKVRCHKLNRYVAIKVLKREFSEDKNFVSKFRAEAQSAAGLSHPNIVNVYDVGDEDGIYYIVMELVEGITLKKYIEKRGKLPYKEAVSIAIQVAKGMEAAHSHHIVHRDIKPQNIIISKEGKVKVTDFGIAKAATSSTINSSAMGSVHYMSPEQARGGYSDERSDIYSFGITLFEMLTGKVPFDGDTTVSVAVQHIQLEIPAPSSEAAGIPISIDKIVLKCTQKKTEKRYQSVSELINDLKKSLVIPDEDFVDLKDAMPYEKTSERADVNPYEEELLNETDSYDLADDELNDDDDDYENDIDDEDNDKLDNIMKWIGVGIVGLILIITIIVVVKLVGGSSGNKGNNSNETASETFTQTQEVSLKQTDSDDKDKAEVPDVRGMTEEEAKAELNGRNLGYKPSYQASSSVEAGKVISQGITPGTKVAKNTTITLSISSGPESVTVPNVIGQLQKDATTALEAAGFMVEKVEYEYSDSVEKDKVINLSPAAGASIAPNSKVTIVVSKGEQVKTATVPNLAGLTYEQAKKLLEDNGLVCKVVRGSLTGKVIHQGYDAGLTVKEGDTVEIVLEDETQPETQTQEVSSGIAAESSAAQN